MTLDQPHVVKVGTAPNGRALWRLFQDFHIHNKRLDPWLRGEPLVIPAGFHSDFASVPQLVMSVTGETAQEGSLPHDYLYQFHGIFLDDGGQGIPKAIADLVFWDVMGDYGPHGWRRYAFYKMVSLFGRGTWDRQVERVVALNRVMNAEDRVWTA